MDLICSDKNFFKNPKNLPLNELYLDYQKIIRVVKNDRSLEEIEEMLKLPASSSDRYKSEYVTRPALDKCWIDRKRYEDYNRYELHLVEDQNKQFLENKVLLETLQFLNNCTFHQFWCYMYYEPNILRVIKDFLHNAVPLHLVSHLSEPILKLHVAIHSCVRGIYRRLLQFKVSESEYLRNDVARSLVQEKAYFTENIVLMLCYVYNSSDPQFVSEVIEYCLMKRDSFLRRINEIFKKIVDELDFFTQTSFYNQKSAALVEEKTFFLFEVAATLHQFLSACPAAVDIAFYVELPYCITYVYQKIYAGSGDLIDRESNGHDWLTFKELIRKWFALGKFEFVNVFHIFTAYCLDAVFNLRENLTKQDEFVELYIGLISNALDNDLFVVAYDKTYSIREQFETLIDCVPNFDHQQSEYLMKSLDSIISEFREPEPEINVIVTPKLQPSFNIKKYDSIYETLTHYLERSSNKKSNLPKNVSLALEQYYELTKQLDGHSDVESKIDSSLVQAVLDVLPHLETDYIVECLQKNNNDVTEVITKILSNTVNSPSVSKKDKYANANEMLDDKKEKASIKQLVLQASYTIDLDDEYDDRYQMGNNINHSDDESRIYRHLEGQNNVVKESESSSSAEEGPPQRDTRSDFCEDPSVLRERRAQQYQKTHRVIPNKSTEQSNEKPKYFKSTRGKHNRKGGASWKRNKGMIPS